MKIDLVMHSVDDNPYYTDFWLMVSKVWKLRFGIDPILLHVTEGGIELSEEFGSVVKIKKIDNIPIHIQAQIARFWYPQFLPDKIWMTSDIDMFPISRTHFISDLEQHDDNVWINLNSQSDYFPVCYNIARGSLFKSVLEMSDNFEEFVDHVKNTLEIDDWNQTTDNNFGMSTHRSENQNNSFVNWGFDESYISKKINSFRDQTNLVLTPARPDNRRIDRTSWGYDDALIDDDFYIDCHSVRPYHMHKETIDRLVGRLLS
tara:strand:+ start:3627 stop:4406 length:780 start_codon:yes stop_codon:yes gene_type:complete